MNSKAYCHSRKGLQEKQEDLVEEIKGPLWNQAFDVYNNPTRAALGFAKPRRSGRIAEKRRSQWSTLRFCRDQARGQRYDLILPDLLGRLVRHLVFPKNMYWREPNLRFVRPIRWLLCLYGNEVVPMELGNLRGDKVTRGHRFMGSSRVEINSSNEYFEKLYDNYVIADQAKRKEKSYLELRQLKGSIMLNHAAPDLVDENVFSGISSSLYWHIR